ncbi:sensor histidine kinase [Nocardia alba]|uniref:histidine kinase n=1 Tax=Nocardia alba TaxID=225051 RepID=A0A4R1FTE6_9NOCA|nr:sensor histidine kinase [Nocardia alba]TCJ96974.1 multi-sensor signal transduction histidine kinase [Nocardia alba]
MTSRTSGGSGTVGRLTAQGWFQLVFALMILVVIVGAAAGAQVISHTSRVTDRLLTETMPAATEAHRLQGALLNQETGIRGYAITGDPQFLEPYDRGRQEQIRAADHLRELLAGHPGLLADLAAVDLAAQRWRADFSDPATGAVSSRAGIGLDAATGAVRRKALFDAVRDTFAVQNDNLVAVVDSDSGELARAQTTRTLVLSGIVAVFLLTGILLTVLVRRLVVRPLRYLTDSSRRVAAGEFDAHIDAVGPSDIALVCEAVENMRHHIVAELDSTRDQEATLLRQKQDLDIQAEELRRSNTELEQFAYVASHDLQEPLRKVASFCQLLEKRYGDQLDERGKQYIDFAVDGAKRMQVLINDLLTFSRVGRMSEGTEPVGLDQTLDEALAALSATIEESGAVIERPETLPELVGEPTLLTMLWQNLIGNAIKFRTPDLAPVVRVACEPSADDPAVWQLSVSDNGIGVAAEFAEKVFVIFQRLHPRDSYGGTGIGLAVCKKIVEFHGGRIWLDTDYRDGTRLCFTLRAAAPVTITASIENEVYA